MKANKIEIEKRVNKVYELILEGCLRRDIVQYCAKNYNIEVRQADSYIAEAYKEMKENSKIDRELEFALAAKRGEYLFNLCMQSKDRRTAIIVLKELNELLGLKTYKIEADGEINIVFKNVSK